ncbi:hypothetical protein GF325_08310 [Candidatus Bathyarchaeota archaeon]|nr:hypothetical protein [Candidatus Bathyarchaeota archaeon]
MIYQFLIIDADSGILIFEKDFKLLKKSRASQSNLRAGVIAEFFNAINTFIDEIQNAMRKGRDVSNMNRTLLAENSTISLVFQPEARVLITCISDPDDDVEIIIAICRKIGDRFWKRHKDTLQNFRITMEKKPFTAFMPDVELLLRDGKIAEIFPQLQINKKTLQRITLMGVISDEEYNVSKLIDGKTSPFLIAKKLKKTKQEVMSVLDKLESLDIIKPLQIPRF